MHWAGRAFRAAGVTEVYLVHGTFVGPDALGVLAELGRIHPSASPSMRRVIEGLMHRLTGEVGNYNRAYARLFEKTINEPGQPKIPVRLFHWSSENHHVGRADGAVRLIDELSSLDHRRSHRVLLWGHSHAGNVFALMTNLLAGDRHAVAAFFDATEVYFRWPVIRCVDVPVWKHVRDMLTSEGRLPLDVTLDMVTFGTPIRYGWDSGGYSRLLHFINHRPVKGLPEYRAPFPPKLDHVLSASDGDYVQQLGIAGTNVMPSLFAWRTWLADRRLKKLLRPRDAGRGPLERFRAGAIVPDEGTTLLVDYGRPEGSIAEHHAGHAVYTQSEWLLFHAEEVAKRFYQASASKAA
jgi:hypothetical protein